MHSAGRFGVHYRVGFHYKEGLPGYEDSIQSSVMTKLKGVTLTNTSANGPRLWDAVDYVFPPQGDSVFFVITNLIQTPDQKLGHCPESSKVPDARCRTDDDCNPQEAVVAGNGKQCWNPCAYHSSVCFYFSISEWQCS
ncbi:hypothetical protein AOXY_G35418 [Acipenser oxyrinchus oxyrinchus]|uniref:Uncharacterized protein n=1 Tax=Acipenser oxyrinchus oxyrinchus TaxID=40147 RepID=A0AAD8FQA7_ACIOX|nr:hypothetical protein AOXY_G35418 [Acipenser oxyrinchus oxyrinchus]